MKNHDELDDQADKLTALAEDLKAHAVADINRAKHLILDAASDAEDGKTDDAMNSIIEAIRKLDINFENDIARLKIISDAIDDAGNEGDADGPGWRVGQ